jgi:hypothetical protein
VPSISEALSEGNSQMQAALDAGIDAISLNQNVVFTLYRKFVFSQDGSVFWIATATTLTVAGALHYASDRLQNEDETLGQNMVMLTSEQEVSQFDTVAPNTLWIGAWPIAPSYAGSLIAGVDTETGTQLLTDNGQPLLQDVPIQYLQVAFGQRAKLFSPAGLWHYSGFTVYPALSSQIVASPEDLPQGPIVSNSLPIWLASSPGVPVYPSYLVPDNIVPPYIVAHIPPESTEAIQAFPVVSWPGSVIPDSGSDPLHSLPWSQLLRDDVELTLYGFTAYTAALYLQSLIDLSLTGAFGFANDPVLRDAKRTQTEISAIAMKKTLRIVANYNLNIANITAIRLLLEAFVSEIIPSGGRAVNGQGGSVQDDQLIVGFGTVGEPPSGQGATVQAVQIVAGTGTVEGL